MQAMTMKMNARSLGWVCSLSLFAHTASALQTELPYTSSSRYNESGQLTGTISANAGANYLATRYTYGTSGLSKGLLLTVEQGSLGSWSNESNLPSAWVGFQVNVRTEYTYDAVGRKATERVVGANNEVESLVQYSYDGWNRVQCKAVRMNPAMYGSLPSSACTLGAEGSFGPDRIFRYTYDNFDQVLTEERAVGTNLQQTYVTNTYAGRGVLRFQSDAKGNLTELRYDGNWRMNRRVYPSPASAGSVNENDYNEYGYDHNGNVTYERKRNGSSISNEYDDNNRLTFKNLSDNTYSADVSYDYDLRGLTLSSRFGSDVGQGITNTFDGFGRLTSATTNVGGTSRTLSYRYDANGNRTRVTHPDDYFFEYGFDGIDRMNSLGESVSTSPTANTSSMLTIDYHSGGGRWHIFRPGSTTTYEQDNVKRLASFTQDFSGTSNDVTTGFDYNPANQVRFMSRSNEVYVAPKMSRVGAYVPNGLNQYTRIAGQDITHDTNGNLTNDASVAYTYDMENRLVSAIGTVSGNPRNASFTWDPLGRLHAVNMGGTVTQYLYDGDSLVGEYQGATMTKRYVHGDQVDEPLVQYSTSTVGASYRRYLHADHQGSIIAHSSNTGGFLTKNVYDPYGAAPSTNTGTFGYTGQMWFKELLINHYKARMYHPRIGRFLQTDPIFYADDMNMYAYVGGDPVNRTDPTGRQQRPTHRDDILYEAAEKVMVKQRDIEGALASEEYWRSQAQEAARNEDYAKEEENMRKAELEQRKYYELSGVSLPALASSSSESSERSEQPISNANVPAERSSSPSESEQRGANRAERGVLENIEEKQKPIELPPIQVPKLEL
jgi:RHS repeat-associated protein